MTNTTALGKALFNSIRNFSNVRPFKQFKVTIYVHQRFLFAMYNEGLYPSDSDTFEGHPVYLVTDERHPNFKIVIEEK